MEVSATLLLSPWPTSAAVIALSSIFGLIPIIINTIAGVKHVDEDLLETARAFAATQGQTLRTVVLPSSLPFIFAGFKIAASLGFKAAVEKAKPVLLEPIMKVEVVTPEDYTGSVIGDLTGRRGQIQGQDMRGNAIVINAMVPLANMFSYVSNLRSMSQGRATFTMQFDHYEQVPEAESKKVQAKYA